MIYVFAIWFLIGAMTGFILGRFIAYRDEQVPTGRLDTDR